MRIFHILLLAAFLCASPGLSHAQVGPSACMRAAIKAEKKYNIPNKLLQAISLVETGHSRDGIYQAWPWTINNGRKGRYFDNKIEAERYVRKNVRLQKSSIDVGCFQINAKWHGKAFKTAVKTLDPFASADYAAKFLVQLHSEFGDWRVASAR